MRFRRRNGGVRGWFRCLISANLLGSGLAPAGQALYPEGGVFLNRMKGDRT